MGFIRRALPAAGAIIGGPIGLAVGSTASALLKKKAKPAPPSMLTQYGSGTAVRTPLPPRGSLY